MLVFLLYLVWDWGTVVFQLLGFYRILVSLIWSAIVSGS